MKTVGTKSRVKAQHRMDSMKDLVKALEVNAVVEIKDYVQHDAKYTDNDGKEQERAADYLEVTANGTDYRLPVTEYTRYGLEGTTPAYQTEGEKCAFPKSFTIKGATARKLNTDASVTLYPMRAYKADVRQELRDNKITWVEMVSDDNNVVEDNKFAPIQDYVIETKF